MTIKSTTILPLLRHDLELFEVMPGLLELYDTAGYTDVTVRLPSDLLALLLEADGQRTIDEIIATAATSKPIDRDKTIEVVQMLEQEGFLQTQSYRDRRDEIHAEYNRLPVRPPAFAGSSYADDPAALRRELDGYLEAGQKLVEEHGAGGIDGVPRGLYVPHIDPRVGGDLYGAAYATIRESDADTFVILGVPHTMRNDRLMFSRMDFDTPLGRLHTDRELIEAIADELEPTLGRRPTLDEAPHMHEHSIEFQTIFLQHLFGDRQVRIVPLLLDGLFEWVESGTGGVEEDAAWQTIYEALRSVPERLGRRVCFIASVDFCHFGRKFGDDREALGMFPEVETHDRRLIAAAERGDHQAFVDDLTATRNAYRVCGVSPMYGLMRVLPEYHGRLLAWDRWDERERDSGVSYAAMRFDPRGT